MRNRALHRLLVDGVTVEYRDAEGSIRGAQARVIDFDDPAGNEVSILPSRTGLPATGNFCSGSELPCATRRSTQ